MKMFKHLLFELLVCFALSVAAMPVALAQPEDQLGFISIDCGLSESENYTDPDTRIFYVSDAGFTDTGENKATLPSPEESRKPYLSVRSFPEGNRSCYTLRPQNGKNNKYLIRARFMYGNYDGKNQTPKFDVYIGEDLWATMKFQSAYDPRKLEIIHTLPTDYLHVCLQKTEDTIPFISALELRRLDNNIYATKSESSLHLYKRWNLGAKPDDVRVRYPDDIYDRIWMPFLPDDRPEVLWSDTKTLSSNLTAVNKNVFQLPFAVMSTAIAPQNSSDDSLFIYWKPSNSFRFYLYLHFAEIEEPQNDELRRSQMYLNGEPWYSEFSPSNDTLTVHSTAPETLQTMYELTINSTKNSRLPPIVNAMEIYLVKNFKRSGTDDNDVAAIFGIKSYYRLERNWQGDPCGPPEFRWDGLGCNDDYSPRIVSLNLSSSGLNGSITSHIANLISVQILDLSNNNLSGNVPEFLAELAGLTVLNLEGNNFTGPIPAKLLEKARQGLSFRIDEQPKNTTINDTGNKKKKVLLPIVASAVATFLLVFFVFVTCYTIRRRKSTGVRKLDFNENKNNGALESKTWLITYSEVLNITNNFEKLLGKGGFGRVYHGRMDGVEVAVKMLNPSSAQGYKEFQAEANLLMNVHHKNLTFLVGYCNEGNNIGIIYEYMVNGNLQQHLSELTWDQRLRTAVDVASGLEYLHHGCKPPMIHRDVKPTNILLDGKFQAKLSDFGLSKAFASEAVSHVSINTIAGSPGYMDPEYFSSYRVTEKSDIYSFGVVLLECITGKPALDPANRSIIDWVARLIEKGDIRTIVDKKLKDNFNINSAWKAVELATSCVSRPSTRRPTMNHVVIELKDCLAIETSSNLEIEQMNLTRPILESDSGPLVR